MNWFEYHSSNVKDVELPMMSVAEATIQWLDKVLAQIRHIAQVLRSKE